MKAPESLAAMQEWMADILTRPIEKVGRFQIPEYDNLQIIQEIERKITNGPHLSARERLGIYHQQYWIRLIKILKRHFPSLGALFGDRDFEKLLAEKYLIQHPPDHWALSQLGDRFVGWIQAEYFEEDRNLVLPMATLDEAYHFLPYREERPSIQKEDLGKVLEKKLFLQPFFAPFAFSYDFFSFREALLEKQSWEGEDFPEIVKFSREKYFIFSNGLGRFSLEEISYEEYVLLKAFQRGAFLEEALFLLDKEAPFDSFFQKWVERSYLFLN